VRGVIGPVLAASALLALAACGSGAIAASTGRDEQSVRYRVQAGQALRSFGALPAPGSTPKADAATEALHVGIIVDQGSRDDPFCTASVVDSPHHNVLITAAHCLYAVKGKNYNRGIKFVPEYNNGQKPYGEWSAAGLFVGKRWKSGFDPNHDVGFIVLRPKDGKNIQDVLGGNRLGIDAGFTNLVRVTGYPGGSVRPVTCVNWTSRQARYQLRFTCAGFFGGTSGSPWVTDFDPLTDSGTVVGVIGGYQEGGKTDSVSYSAYLSRDTEKLYRRAAR
jgi:V8-like Glu-specific endopeptidase